MSGRVFAVDPSAYRSADDAVGVALRTIGSASGAVIGAAHRVFGIENDDGYNRASLVAHLAGALASTIEAVHEVLPTRSPGSPIGDLEAHLSIHCVGQVRLVVIEGNRTTQARALLETEYCDLLSSAGLDSSPAYSALGVRPLPLPESAVESFAASEITLAVADSVLAAIPRELLEDAAGGTPSESSERTLGRRLYRSLFPGRSQPVGAEILWRDAIVLGARAVTGFAQWRSLMTAYQSAVGDEEALAGVMERALSSVVATAASIHGS